ncbi:MAG: 8-amino-7-oxononanoate synthase [Candidatus Syntropharchaeia archaeon]
MLKDVLSEEIFSIKSSNLFRYLKTSGACTSRTRVNGKEVILLCSTNYLGLSTHPKVKKACIEAAERYGCGSGGSRLICGNTELHEKLEERIAKFKKTEAALVFNTGYMANIGVLSCIAREGDVIISDELNHASIVDGCRLSRADVKIYSHRNTEDLERILRDSGEYRLRLIVTESIFSMDGDIAPLREIADLAEEYDASLFVDEAHATGVIGKNGRGVVDLFGLKDRIEIQMGTLSKAIASSGGYVAGNSELIDFLINRARSFIFSTALPPPVVGSAIAAIDVIEKDEDRRKHLWENVNFFRKGLEEIGVNVMGETQIVPILIGDARRTVEISEQLEREGVFVTGIRPPTVPPNTSRLRATIMATHTKEDLEGALCAVERVFS